MRIFVQAKPSVKNPYIKKIDEIHYIVAVKEPASIGKANEAIIKSLSVYFQIPQSMIYLKSGFFTKNKCYEIIL